MRRDNPVNKTQLVLTLRSCSKLGFNASGGGVRQGTGEEKPFPLHCWMRNAVTFHLPLWLRTAPILSDC